MFYSVEDMFYNCLETFKNFYSSVLENYLLLELPSDCSKLLTRYSRELVFPYKYWLVKKNLNCIFLSNKIHLYINKCWSGKRLFKQPFVLFWVTFVHLVLKGYLVLFQYILLNSFEAMHCKSLGVVRRTSCKSCWA